MIPIRPKLFIVLPLKPLTLGRLLYNIIILRTFSFLAISQKTYILDVFLQNGWVDGPVLQEARAEHGCTRIRLNNNSNKMSIIVTAGANAGGSVSSTEIIDEGANGGNILLAQFEPNIKHTVKAA